MKRSSIAKALSRLRRALEGHGAGDARFIIFNSQTDGPGAGAPRAGGDGRHEAFVVSAAFAEMSDKARNDIVDTAARACRCSIELTPLTPQEWADRAGYFAEYIKDAEEIVV